MIMRSKLTLISCRCFVVARKRIQDATKLTEHTLLSSQVQIQGLVDTTNALKEDVDVLKLSVNAAVASPPQAPTEAALDSGSSDQTQPVDRVMLEGLVQSYVSIGF